MRNFEKMNMAQLDLYASEHDVDLSEAKTKAQKIAALKAAEVEEEYLEIEVRGRTLKIGVEAITSFEFIDCLDQLEQRNAIKMASMFRLLFGDDFQNVMNWVKGDKKLLPLDESYEFFTEIFEAVEAKNS